MRRLQLNFVIGAMTVLAVCANGQDRLAGMGQTQTFTGVLLDANCSELRSMSSTTGMTGPASTPGTAAGTIQDSSGIARPGAPGPGGAAEDPVAGTGSARVGQAAAGGHGGSQQVRNCMATSSTSSYALYSEGRVLHLDPESNSQIRKHLQSDNQSANRARAGAAGEPTHVQVQGQLQLKVTSVQPMRGASQNP